MAVIYLVVMHFNSAGSIAVGEYAKVQGYTEYAECRKAIPIIQERWHRMNYPMPDKISCERLEIKK